MILSFILLGVSNCFAQNNILSLGLWNITSVSGELKAGGLYGQGSTSVYGLYNKSESSKLFGGLLLKTSSYLWNPSFMKIEVDGGYYPQTSRNQYLIFPNYYDVYNAKRLHLSTIFFERKPVSLNLYMNLDQSFDNRENLTDINTNSKSCGGMLALKYKILPMTTTYNESNWDSREVATGRSFTYIQKNWDSRATKSFGKRDRSELIYIKRDYTRKDYNVNPSRNIYDNLELRNNYALDSIRNSYINSDIVGTNQVGVDSYRQLRVAETFMYKLPHDLKLNSGYSYINTQRPNESMIQNNGNLLLSHQLFLSLHSDLIYEYIGTKESTYTEDNNKIGASVSYSKKIPTNGNFTLTYAYSLTHEDRKSADVNLEVMNEPYVLADNQVVLIKVPSVILSSVVIKDVTGTITYQQYLDYVLIQYNNYTEIRRVPGGQIPNNATVYLFYSATQPGQVQYDLNSNNFMASVTLFGQFLNLYYTNFSQSYFNTKNTDNLNLNYLSNDIYGTRVVYKFLTLGAELNDYRSSIYPYKIMRYFMILQGNYHNRINFAINANSREYLKLATDSTHRLYQDISGMVSYIFNSKTKLDLTAGYQYQDGRDINLNLFTSRLKVTKIIRRLTCSAGFDMFKRDYLLTQKSDYTGGFIQIVKKF